jgi:hypothetical protein
VARGHSPLDSLAPASRTLERPSRALDGSTSALARDRFLALGISDGVAPRLGEPRRSAALESFARSDKRANYNK